MIFTLYYMYATFIQWWRLGSLRNKLNGTLNSHNALLVCNEAVVYETKKSRSFENLLFKKEERIGCTIVPRQKVNLSQWVAFPKDHRYFPIYFNSSVPKISPPYVYIVVQAMLDTYMKHSADLLEIEHFGELVAWRVSDYFEAVIRTDMDKLARLVHCYSHGDVDINHELKLLKFETVDVEGIPARIRYEKKFPLDVVLKYSHASVHWKKFTECVKELYSRVRDSTNPKITIENGKSEESRKVPVNEVKPIKKDRRHEDRHTLEVAPGDHRRYKSGDHKKDKNSPSKTETSVSDVQRRKASRAEGGSRERHHRKEEDDEHARKDDDKSRHRKRDEDKDRAKHHDRHHERKKDVEDKVDGRRRDRARKDDNQTDKQRDRAKRSVSKEEESSRGRSDVASCSVADTSRTSKSETSPKKDTKRPAKRTTSSEKKVKRSLAVDDTESESKYPQGNGQLRPNANAMLARSSSVKPPNILVYADSLVAKENVKTALLSMVNREKYIIYDLPTDSKQMFWDQSTVLVVVCGTVPPSLTFNLLQYLLQGGQLLCLCSDLLYSVLHTFTTAEVREHELVCFNYGRWKQVKMMHHIFCYQASPAKKQFSKDSDQSNQSTGSSPIAPCTPSVVELQHNGKDYMMQVQVLGTEETWQTPSLLLATVKGGEGRAVFSQVHLEINPNQYEDDENKFQALKDSDSARLEILKDILSTRLDIHCNSVEDPPFTPGYFLGRHEMKMKLLTDRIQNNKLETEKITIRFCGKDETTDAPSCSFLPVHIHSCPSNFSTVNYFEALETRHIGRLVIYSDVLESSRFIISKPLTHGLVVIPRRQLSAAGRAQNTWLSPEGSACFSLQMHIGMESTLGKSLSLLQHMIMVSVVSAIKRLDGCQGLSIGIKWPNDLYANGNIKIGGIVVQSSISGDVAIANIGCGLNLSNRNPTTCVNELIRARNEEEGTDTKTIPFETYFASVFNEIERIYERIQSGDIDYLFDLYYKYWLHNNSDITVASKSGETEHVKILGIDDYGYLKVRGPDGCITVVQPDGNSFDMLRGLICPKVF